MLLFLHLLFRLFLAVLVDFRENRLMAVRAEGVLVKVNVVGVESQLSAAVRAGVGNQVVVGIFLLVGIILIVSLVGELLNYFLPLPVPASIYGLVLMFLCLMLGVIKLSDVHDTACFLIEIMPIMFIPPAVGLMASWDVIQANLVAYLIIAAVTTIVVMAVSGLVTQEVLKKGKKGAEKK